MLCISAVVAALQGVEEGCSVGCPLLLVPVVASGGVGPGWPCVRSFISSTRLARRLCGASGRSVQHVPHPCVMDSASRCTLKLIVAML